MTQYINQGAGDLSVTINRGNSWTTDITVNKVLTGYTITSWIKYGSNTVSLTVTETDLSAGKFNIALSAANSAAINVQDCTLFVKWVYGTEARTIISGQFRVIQ